MKPVFDEEDAKILEQRLKAFNERQGPRVGDFIRFVDGVLRRIGEHIEGVGYQSTDGGQFYLGEGYCAYSGTLHPLVPEHSLMSTGETRSGSAWFFHHNQRFAHNGVDVEVEFRLFACMYAAPR